MQQTELKNEALHSPEIPRGELVLTSENGAELSAQKVEVVIQERIKMLGEIKGALSHTLGEALAIKIEHEHEALKAMVDADVKMQEMRKNRNAVLPHDFFKKKLLNPNSL